jgi:competence protein ComEC
VAAAFFGLLLCRVGILLYTESQETLPHYVGTNARVVGIVVADPDVRATSMRVTLDVSTVNGAEAEGKLIVSLALGNDVSYGDTLAVAGKIESPQNFITDTGRDFDYVDYLRLQGVSALIERATLESSTSGGVSLYRGLFALKHEFENALAKILPPQDAALMEGVLLGARHGLSDQLEQGLVDAGLIHIVILAGYVLSLIADIAARAAEKVFSKRTALFLVAGFLILFVLMTGGASTTVRACLMALVALLARLLNRPSAAMRALIFAAAVMIVWNPLIVLYDESFIISVLATFGLVTCGGWVEHRLNFITERFELRGIASSSLTVQLFALPALLYFTGTVSLVSVPANLLVLPILPFLMLAGWLAACLALVPALGTILSFIPALIAHWFLAWIVFIVYVVQQIPFASITAPPIDMWIVILLYIPLIALALRIYFYSLRGTFTK